MKIQNVAVTVLSGVPHGIDGDTYFSPKIPNTVRAAVPLMQDESRCPPALFRAALGLAVKAMMKGRSPGDSVGLTCQDIENLGDKAKGFSYGEVSLLVTGATLLIATAVRNRTKVSVVQKVSVVSFLAAF